MKKTILLSAVLAVGASFATEVTSGNAVGVLEKAISTSDADQILISVPFLGYENGGAVKVCDMVKTSNLDEGSKLYVPDDKGTYNTWTLNASGEWVADQKVTIVKGGTPDVGTSDNQANATVERGSAFWLEPVFKNEESSDTIFLLGQAADGAGTSTAVKNCWNLIGNASIADKTIELNTIKGQNGDQIVAQVGGLLRYYTYTTDNGWRYKEKGKWKSDSLVIKAGQGFWYKYASTEENTKTIQW